MKMQVNVSICVAPLWLPLAAAGRRLGARSSRVKGPVTRHFLPRVKEVACAVCQTNSAPVGISESCFVCLVLKQEQKKREFVFCLKGCLLLGPFVSS